MSLTLIRLNVFVNKAPKIDTNHRNIRSVGRNIEKNYEEGHYCRKINGKFKIYIQDIHVLNEKYYVFLSLI